MQIKVKFLDNLKVQALFDDYEVIADQPIRYKGDGSAPGPFDYFLASSALCAGYFVKIYCQARNINTTDIEIIQDNTISPENRYLHHINLNVKVPDDLSQKDQEGIAAAVERCSVKRVIQNHPDFHISVINNQTQTCRNSQLQEILSQLCHQDVTTMIPGKDAALESTVKKLAGILSQFGYKIELGNWRNPLPQAWSVHIRDADCPMCFANGKGQSQLAALASALGEFFERLLTNYFYSDYYLGPKIANEQWVHHPQERWFKNIDDPELMDEHLRAIYCSQELTINHLIDTNSGRKDRGICALPFTRQSDGKVSYIPVNLIGNLFVSNGMAAGNTIAEAKVQALCEIFERAVKNHIITKQLSLPDVPTEVLSQYPHLKENIATLRERGFPVYVKDASLGGQFPVMCVAIMNPKTGGSFASFGSHPHWDVAVERCLTELMQGRSFEGLNDIAPPTFDSYAITEPNNIVDHFIDSTGVISWRFFSDQSDYEYVSWNFTGSNEQQCDHLIKLLHKLNKEVYISSDDELNVSVTRILVPNYSEIYEASDLIWDNNNQAISYRDEIIHLHSLSNQQTQSLIDRLNENGHDDYMAVSELIGITFPETSVWGNLNVGELKCLCHLKLGQLNEARSYIDAINQFTDMLLDDRKKLYQLLGLMMTVINDYGSDQLANYQRAFSQMYGLQNYNDALAMINGEMHFPGLDPIDLSLDQGDNQSRKHIDLIMSYEKLRAVRSRVHKT